MLLSNKKEWDTNICYDLDEPQKHQAKWKKPDAEDHVLYLSIYMKHPWKANWRSQRAEQGSQSWDWETDAKQATSGVTDTPKIGIVVMVMHLSMFALKNLWMVHLKLAILVGCKIIL